MSFFKSFKNKLTPPKAKIMLKLNKNSSALGENVEGSLNISSEEEFDATEIRCEIQCVEEAKRIKRVFDENFHTYVNREVRESATLYSAKPAVSGSMKINNGYTGTFPFSINVPAGGRPTFKSVDGKVTWLFKGVIAVDGRPDITSSVTELQVTAPTVAPVAAPSAPVVKEVIREVVMIPCKYCGTLMPQTQTACPNCGGKRTV